ncbi:MAG: glycosyltransferase family 2 protein [Microcystis aeruginosa Ma_QC_Ch_20071001_S25]|uniref:Glycosyltransferase family 2 protein n=1 Tax=Microcystis aeruginosa Ma_QC_Ch_20071001_S25D TaxID=2486250 RepID=A0A552FDT0_MICAE|nr:MAG: glycosyltransferase family 2 protein [Microcystis aeruginosa Ma_QC_Ch_20071001_S25D]TRU47551.1 MAG: glycosyltransferase family 2 protein [Microcystis aeruginosa Ma_QC_Ch_20071001_S25]TRU56055.1 MAG: glycosyltransferase family 2 protein [Microcystis aeruginosa Ma_QC_Ch_20071001_M135]
MADFQLTTPVAFLIFNRPDTTARVFEAIRQAKPPKLLVVADGLRPDRADDIEKCKAARAIIDGVDWDCEVLTNYSDVNLGCKSRVSSGLNWVFDTVEEAIILEDDCLPHPSFFQFCEELLEYYRHDQRIMVISGDNFQFGRKRTEYSYYFSRYNHIWGWASWRRAWQYYDLKMKLWQEISDGSWLESILGETQAVKYWTKIFQTAYDNKVDSWDYGWTFACWIQNGLTILPNVNLVSNIGFGADATHTSTAIQSVVNNPVREMSFPLQHPPFITRHFEADRFTWENIYRPQISLLFKLKSKILKLLGDT